MSGDANAMVWEFSRNGAVQMGNDRGRYTFGSNNRLKVETSFASSVYQLEIVSERMTLRKPDGSKLEFTKIPEGK
jgi:hypothetical protein